MGFSILHFMRSLPMRLTAALLAVLLSVEPLLLVGLNHGSGIPSTPCDRFTTRALALAPLAHTSHRFLSKSANLGRLTRPWLDAIFLKPIHEEGQKDISLSREEQAQSFVDAHEGSVLQRQGWTLIRRPATPQDAEHLFHLGWRTALALRPWGAALGLLTARLIHIEFNIRAAMMGRALGVHSPLSTSLFRKGPQGLSYVSPTVLILRWKDLDWTGLNRQVLQKAPPAARVVATRIFEALDTTLAAGNICGFYEKRWSDYDYAVVSYTQDGKWLIPSGLFLDERPKQETGYFLYRVAREYLEATDAQFNKQLRALEETGIDLDTALYGAAFVATAQSYLYDFIHLRKETHIAYAIEMFTGAIDKNGVIQQGTTDWIKLWLTHLLTSPIMEEPLVVQEAAFILQAADRITPWSERVLRIHQTVLDGLPLTEESLIFIRRLFTPVAAYASARKFIVENICSSEFSAEALLFLPTTAPLTLLVLLNQTQALNKIIQALRAKGKDWLGHLSALYTDVNDPTQAIHVPGLGKIAMNDLSEALASTAYPWQDLDLWLHQDPTSQSLTFGLFQTTTAKRTEIDGISLLRVPASPISTPLIWASLGLNTVLESLRLDVIISDHYQYLLLHQLMSDRTVQIIKDEIGAVFVALAKFRKEQSLRLANSPQSIALQNHTIPWFEILMNLLVDDLKSLASYARKVDPSFFDPDSWGTQEEKWIELWYFSLFTNPEGLFGKLTKAFSYHPNGTTVLSDSESAAVVDTLLTLSWSAPVNQYSSSAILLPVAMVMSHLSFMPRSVLVKDWSTFLTFLKQDFDPDPTPEKFQEWRSRWKARAERFGSENKHLQLAYPMAPPEGELHHFFNENPSLYSPVVCNAQSFPLIAKMLGEDQSLIYSATYHDGVAVPGSSVKFKVHSPKVTNGDRLFLRVHAGQFQILPLRPTAPDTEGVPWNLNRPLVDIPLKDAFQESFRESTGYWERLPNPHPLEIQELPSETALEDDLLYRADTASGILHLHTNYIDTYLDVRHWSALLLQTTSHGIEIYSQQDHSYLGMVTKDGHLSSRGTGSAVIRILPPLPESVRQDNRLNSYETYQRLLLYGTLLAPLLKGSVIRHFRILHEVDGDRFEHHGSTLWIRRPDAPHLVEAAQDYIQKNDPLAVGKACVAKLIEFQDSERLLEEPPKWPEDLKADALPADLREEAKQLTLYKEDAEKILHNLSVVRAVVGDSTGDRRVKPAVLGRTVLRALRRYEDSEPRFAFIDGKNQRSNDPLLESAQAPYPWAGFIYEPFWTLNSANQTHLNKKTTAGTPLTRGSTRYLFVRLGPKDSDTEIRLYNADTGQPVDFSADQLLQQKIQFLSMVNTHLPPADLLSSETLEAWLRPFESPKTILMLATQVLSQQWLTEDSHAQAPQINALLLQWWWAKLHAIYSLQGPDFKDQPLLYVSENLWEELHWTFLVIEDALQLSLPDTLLPELFEEILVGLQEEPMLREAYEASVGHDMMDALGNDVINLWARLRFLRDSSALDMETGEWIGDQAIRSGFTEHPTRFQRFMIQLLKRLETVEEQDVELSPEETRLTRAERNKRALHLTFYGGAAKIGDSAIGVKYFETAYNRNMSLLTDMGANVQQNFQLAATGLLNEPLDAVILTHDHTDHIGGLPLLARAMRQRFNQDLRVYVTEESAVLLPGALRALVRDARKQYAETGRFNALADVTDQEINDLLEHVYVIPYNTDVSISPHFKFRLQPAGHLAGAASVYFMTPDGNTFISSDFSVKEQGFTKGAFNPGDIPVHTAVMESTYGMQPEGNLPEEYRSMATEVNDVLLRKGTVLFAVNAMGRAQTVLKILLELFNPEVQIYLDGDAARVTDDFRVLYPQEFATSRIRSIPEIARLRKMSIESVRNEVLASKRPKIIVSSSGSGTFGASRGYIEALKKDYRNGIFFTSFMGPEEMGRRLLDGREPAEAEIRKFNLPGHASGQEIIDFMRPWIGTLKRVILVHPGSRQNQEDLRRAIQRENWPDVKVYAGANIRTIKSVIAEEARAWFNERFGEDGQGAPSIEVVRTRPVPRPSSNRGSRAGSRRGWTSLPFLLSAGSLPAIALAFHPLPAFSETVLYGLVVFTFRWLAMSRHPSTSPLKKAA